MDYFRKYERRKVIIFKIIKVTKMEQFWEETSYLYKNFRKILT